MHAIFVADFCGTRLRSEALRNRGEIAPILTDITLVHA